MSTLFVDKEKDIVHIDNATSMEIDSPQFLKYCGDLFYLHNTLEISNLYQQISNKREINNCINFYLALLKHKENPVNSKYYLEKSVNYSLNTTINLLYKCGELEYNSEFTFFVDYLLKKYPENIDLWSCFGQYLLDNYFYNECIEVFKTILNLSNNQNSMAILKLAYAYLCKDMLQQAEQYAFKATTFEDSKLEAFMIMSSIKYLKGEHEFANSLFEKQKRIIKDSYFFFLFKANFYQLIGDAQAELSHLQKALEVRPFFLGLQRRIFNLYKKSGSADEKAINIIVNICSNSATINEVDLYNLFQLGFKYNQTKFLLDFFNRNKARIKINKNIIHALYKSFLKEQLFTQAKDYLKQYIQLESNQNKIIIEKARFDFEIENFVKASKKLQNIEEFILTNVDYCILAALTYSKLLDIKKSLFFYNNALKMCNNEYERRGLELILFRIYQNNKLYEQAYEICKKYKDEYNVVYLAEEGVLAYLLGEKDCAAKLIDYPTVSQVYNIENLGIVKNSSEFNDKLKEVLLRNKSLKYQPSRNATRNGWHSEILDLKSNTYLCTIEKLIKKAVFEYSKYLLNKLDSSYSVRKFMLKDFKINSWTVIMEKGGHQQEHIHNDGWISGVYYVSIPKEIENDKEKTGWLELGRVKENFLNDDYPKYTIKPQEGMIVLFPSYMWHKTIPIQGDEKRICLAFDIV
jgi:uncharacterized protein (TIGR02466 family)